MILKKPIDEDIETEIEQLTEEFNELKNQISQARKQEIDTTFIDVMLVEYSALVKLVQAAYNPDDLKRLRQYVKALKNELTQAEAGDPFIKIVTLIREAYTLLRNGKTDEARQIYTQIHPIYKRLDPELRRIVYSACKDVYEKICSDWSEEEELKRILAP
jgi:alanyl-tRNA synthetase